MPASSPVVVTAVATHAAATTPAVSIEHVHVAAPVVTPPVAAALVIATVPAQVLPLAAIPTTVTTPGNVNPSLVALARTVTPRMDRTESTAFAGPAQQSLLSNISLPGMPTFALHADPVPWLTGLRARLNLYNFTDAARVNVAVSLLTLEVQNVWAHAFLAGMQCTFDEFCEWLASNLGKHDADDEIIRKLQSLRQRGKIAAYCKEFLTLWNKLQNKPDESLQIKWFHQGLQQRVHNATLYDESSAAWTGFSRLQAAVLHADACIHSHIRHYREK